MDFNNYSDQLTNSNDDFTDDFSSNDEENNIRIKYRNLNDEIEVATEKFERLKYYADFHGLNIFNKNNYIYNMIYLL